jgi:hypothetical protein
VQNRLRSEIWDAQPNDATTRFVESRAQGRTSFLGARTSTGCICLAGQSPRILVEIHGNAR